MIGELQRVRPNFRDKDLLLHSQTGELSYLPEEFAPHTILVSVAKPKVCEFVFEYQIDEDANSEKIIDIGIKGIFGKYTDKVLKLSIDFSSLKDLIGKLAIASTSLNTKKGNLNKESYRKHYDLVIRILGRLETSLIYNENLKKMVEDAC